MNKVMGTKKRKLKLINEKKRYFLNSAILTALVTVFTGCFCFYFRSKLNGETSTGLLIVSILLFAFCIFECASIGFRMFFTDLTVFCRNENYVFFNAGKLKAKKKLHKYCGVLINLVNFKYINQKFGVKNGDAAIKLYAQALSNFVKDHKGVYSARLGGDNYFIILKNKLLEEFQAYVKEIVIPLVVDGETQEVPIKSRIGIEHYTDDSEISTMAFHGIIAVGVAKSTGQEVVVFDKSMTDDFENEKKIISDVKLALKRNEFIPYYQPKVDINTGILCGCESLARWNHNGALVPPGKFVPPMEKDGMITELDFAIFEQVCKDISEWIKNGIEPVRISSNFSKYHLKNPEFVKQISEIQKKYGIDGKYLEVELTESAGVSDPTLISKVSDEIKALGIAVSIDDFGTGYSSLSMLQSVDADVVKMDKSFLDNSFKDESKQFLIDVINIVKHQNKEVLFEGVEEAEQVEFLKKAGCDVIQGYYYDKPLTHDDFENRLKNPAYNK